MDKIMSLLELSQTLLTKITNLNAKFIDTINTRKASGILTTVQQENLDQLEAKFNGDVTIVVHDDPLGVGPFTIPGLSDVVDFSTFKNFNPFKAWMNQILGLKVDIDKVGDTFNVTSNTKVVLYVPEWFLSDKAKLNGVSVNLDDDIRIGIVLHEIGHSDTLNSAFFILSLLASLLGFILFIIGSLKLLGSKSTTFFSKNKNVSKDSEPKKEEQIDKSTLQNLALIISGIFFYIVVSKLLRSAAETGADTYSSKFGYGDDLADFLKQIYIHQVEDNKTFNSIFSLIKELIDRIKTGYPSINWRAQDLLNGNITENSEYITELDFSFLNNTLEPYLIKLNMLISKLPSLNNIRQVRNIRTINENIDILINHSY